jgi:hypothetical protein
LNSGLYWVRFLLIVISFRGLTQSLAHCPNFGDHLRLPDLIEKEKAVREVEASIWEVINATNYYSHGQFQKTTREFPAHLADVKEFWGRYRKLNLTSAEEPHIKEFEAVWNRSLELVNESYALADELTGKYLAFWESVHEADDVIDFEIQEHLKKRLN